MSLEPGTRLGAYEILAPAGAGGMGEVYKAKDTRLERTVAIKVLPSHLSDSDELRERFEREAKAVSALNHPNICTLHDVGRDGGTDFIVMEYVEGDTLAERLKKGALPLSDALTIGQQIADALDKAHRHDIVHRDLKPANVMLTKSGAKLLDFGLAKHASSAESADGDLSALPTAAKELTEKGAILGTFQYMSPEQLEGEAVSPQTDIFALGLVLFEMVTGKKAFEGKSQASLISAIMSSEAPSLSTLEPMSPPALDAIVRTCLAKSPDDRWSSAGDVGRQLRLIAEGGSEPAPPSTIGISKVLAVGAAAALAGLAVGVVAPWRSSETPPATTSVKRLSIPAPPGAKLRGNMELSPDGESLVFVTREGETNRLYRRSLGAWESVLIPGIEFPVDLSFSPDGQWIAFGSGGSLNKVSLSGGAPVRLTEGDTGAASDWGDNGLIAFGAAGRGVFVVSENGGEPVALTDPDNPARDPQWLPGDEHLLIVSARGIELLDVESKARTFLIEGDSSRYAASGHIVFARGTTLWAVPFDVDALELTGAPVPFLENVDRSTNYARYALDDTGTLAYLPRRSSGSRSLIWVDETGRDSPVDASEADDYYEPRLSPDGTRVALSIGWEAFSNVWVVELETGRRRPITFEGSNLQPRWSSDGLHVLYASLQETGSYGVFRRLERGSVNVEPVLVGENARMWDLASHGRIAFNEASFTADLYTWSADEGSVSLGETQGWEFAPRFDPSGEYLAYVSNGSGRPEVYVLALESRETWMVSTDGGQQPVWARNGRTLFYRIGSEMWSVAVAREPEFLPGTPRLLFEAPYSLTPQHPSNSPPNYDVAPDGRFLMFRDEDAVGADEIRIILGLHQELERLAPTR